MENIKHIGDFVNYLAQKAGVAADNKTLISFLSNPDLCDIKVEPGLVSAITDNLENIDAAMDKHPDVRNKYRAQALNPFDKMLTEMIESLDPESSEELKNIRNTKTRFDLYLEKIKATALSVAEEDGSMSEEQMKKTIEEINAEMQRLQELGPALEAKYQADLESLKIDSLFRDAIAKQRTVLDGLPPDVARKAAYNLTRKFLDENLMKLSVDENGVLKATEPDGLSRIASDVIDSVMANKRLLKVNDSQSDVSSGPKVINDTSNATNTHSRTIENLNRSAMDGLNSIDTNN